MMASEPGSYSLDLDRITLLVTFANVWFQLVPRTAELHSPHPSDHPSLSRKWFKLRSANVWQTTLFTFT